MKYVNIVKHLKCKHVYPCSYTMEGNRHVFNVAWLQNIANIFIKIFIRTLNTFSYHVGFTLSQDLSLARYTTTIVSSSVSSVSKHLTFNEGKVDYILNQYLCFCCSCKPSGNYLISKYMQFLSCQD